MAKCDGAFGLLAQLRTARYASAPLNPTDHRSAGKNYFRLVVHSILLKGPSRNCGGPFFTCQEGQRAWLFLPMI